MVTLWQSGHKYSRSKADLTLEVIFLTALIRNMTFKVSTLSKPFFLLNILNYQLSGYMT